MCANEVADTKECLSKWSGALACPDGTGKYYAVGVYYSEEGGCGRQPPPSKFIPLVTRSAREGLINIIKTADNGPSPYSNLKDTDCDPDKGYKRCPLGKCIDKSHMCDGYPDCSDVSDEDLKVCGSFGPSTCTHINSTHCECPSKGDMLCRNSVCVSRTKYCDGNDDCGDGSDEPQSCSTNCAVGLDLMDPSKICDNKIDCVTFLDLGNDESADRCCQQDQVGDRPYRCMLGKPTMNSANDHVSFTPSQCLPRKYVCDGDPDRSQSCANGADESDCLSLWPSSLKKVGKGSAEVPTDPFGRYRSQAEGYLYFISNGRSFLYCASALIFVEAKLKPIGNAICKSEGYDGLVSIALHSPNKIQRADFDNPLPPEEEQHFKGCQLVYLVCSKKDNEM